MTVERLQKIYHVNFQMMSSVNIFEVTTKVLVLLMCCRVTREQVYMRQLPVGSLATTDYVQC